MCFLKPCCQQVLSSFSSFSSNECFSLIIISLTQRSMNNNETKRNLKLDAGQTSKQQIYKRDEKKWENVPIKWQKQQAKKSYENLIKINQSPRHTWSQTWRKQELLKQEPFNKKFILSLSNYTPALTTTSTSLKNAPCSL